MSISIERREFSLTVGELIELLLEYPDETVVECGETRGVSVVELLNQDSGEVTLDFQESWTENDSDL